MPLMIRQIGADESLSAHLALDALGDVIPPAVIAAVIAQHRAQKVRDRKLPAGLTLVLCIAMNFYAHEALPAVFRRLVSGLRWLWPVCSDLQVSKSAISQAHYRPGAQPVVSLFHRVCQPLATPDTSDAVLFGLRLPTPSVRTPVLGRPGSARWDVGMYRTGATMAHHGVWRR